MKRSRCLLAGLITGVLLFTSVSPVSAANGAGSITFSAEETSVDAVGSSTKKKYTKDELIDLARKYYKKYESANVPPSAYAEELLDGRVSIALFENHSTHTATLARYNVNYYGIGYDDIFLTKVDLSKMDTSSKKTSALNTASKAARVKSKKIKKTKEQLTVWGVDKNGKIVWKYKTKAYPAAQCDVTLCVIKRGRVYIFEAGKVTALEKTTGKKIWVCKNITGGSQVAAVDDSGNVYVTGYLDTYDVYKINSKGKRVWKISVRKTGNYWAYKASVKSGKLTITYEANQSDPSGKRSHKVILKTGNGKILKYY